MQALLKSMRGAAFIFKVSAILCFIGLFDIFMIPTVITRIAAGYVVVHVVSMPYWLRIKMSGTPGYPSCANCNNINDANTFFCSWGTKTEFDSPHD
jgi:hypothetical protein